MSNLDSRGLRAYSQQVEQQIDEYADLLEELEGENRLLRERVDDLCDEVNDLREALSRAAVAA